MQIISSDNIDWPKIFLENEYIIVNYQPSSDCKGCAEMNELFQRLDKYKEYKKVKFLWVDSRNNPVAEQFIKKNKRLLWLLLKKDSLLNVITFQMSLN